MKICVTASNNDLESQIDPRFGRCSYFIIYDSLNGTFEAIVNPNIDADSGAGIQSAQLVISKKASVIITGEVGPKAKKVLQMAGLQIIAGCSGSVKEAIGEYKNNIDVDIGFKNNGATMQTKPGMTHCGNRGLKIGGRFGRILGRS